LREKSEKLTGYFEFLINAIDSEDISIITPKKPKRTGLSNFYSIKKCG